MVAFLELAAGVEGLTRFRNELVQHLMRNLQNFVNVSDEVEAVYFDFR